MTLLDVIKEVQLPIGNAIPCTLKIKEIKDIPEAHEVMSIPNCPSCSKRGIKRNGCHYIESEYSSTVFQDKYNCKGYLYHCGHYRQIRRKI
tara:strand:- start:51 stop:323 length:273 start_codon:yes stop_codon:yes gene_type:complete